MITTTRRCCTAYLGRISSLTSLSQLTVYMNGNTGIDISDYCNSGFWKVTEMSDALFKQFFPQSYANGLTYNPGDFTIFIFHINAAGTQNYPKYACGLITSPRLLNNPSKTKYAMAYSFFTLWNNGIAATYELHNQTETINNQQYDF